MYWRDQLKGGTSWDALLCTEVLCGHSCCSKGGISAWDSGAVGTFTVCSRLSHSVFMGYTALIHRGPPDLCLKVQHSGSQHITAHHPPSDLQTM